jgi:hypothetical protein
VNSVATASIPIPRDAQAVAALLDSDEIAALVADLEATRWTGRPGYPIRAMVGMTMVKSMYAIPTWTRTVRLVAEHEALQRALGSAPSLDSCYRFTRKLRHHRDLLDACIASVLDAVKDAMPEFGETVAIDGSDMPAYANGQRFVSKGGKLRERFSDPDATWGHRSSISTRSGGGYYGYKVHAAVCVTTGLPAAWQVETAKTAETVIAPQLLDMVQRRGTVVRYAVMDRGYDTEALHADCEARNIRPIISLRATTGVKQGKHLPRTCDHGTWTFAGSDAKRGASKWRCPTAECEVKSEWVKADRLHPLVPRTTDRFKSLYHQRGAVEREFGRLKHEWALLPLRVRGMERVRLHADLTILAQLGAALAKTRVEAVPLAA